MTDEPGDEELVELFTSAEKIRSVVEAMQAQLEHDSTGSGRVIRRMIRLASSAGVLAPFTAQLPSWEQPQEWDQRLTLAIGLGLALCSDGYEPDVDAARQAAEQVLAQLFANTER